MRCDCRPLSTRRLPTIRKTDRQCALRVAHLRMALETVAGIVSHMLHLCTARVLRAGRMVRLRRVAVLRVHADGRRRVAVQRQQPGAQPQRLHGTARRAPDQCACCMKRKLYFSKCEGM